ncbi:MAG TPA: acyclic terpene utilization AtuA family protein, partial [Reyranella sp.]|nr:acyclic terpene utilization AtuA family protein [Reyranella sp.]
MFKLFAPTGCVGFGFSDTSFAQGLRQEPEVIGIDAGSCDPGPAYLAAGECFVPRDSVASDLSRILPEAKLRKIPVLIGTAGGAGGNPHVDWALDIVREIAAAHKISLKVAVIRSEFSKQKLRDAYAKGRIKPLRGAPKIDEDAIDKSTRVVGMMGLEPFQEALKLEPDLVLAGRACDASIFAAAPVMKGIPRSIALHAAKIIQCGNGAVVQRIIPDGMLG